ncbi:hypothetical protein PHMEG_00029555 [Phytophthora megakarya]|uniref:Reverse transcriptase RNase H-like domain-containing protein n=1 Tax=Phytophthora megakarya TaxID=4795 RepID=A0A225V1V2_9STRA|nr:hypothetical protein PHMEG_00029555 [Phytophthora megakarya]
MCFNRAFTGAQKNWAVLEKEPLPIVMACEKLTYLLLRSEGFMLYCDHRNLIQIFTPGDDIKTFVRGKRLMWH